MDSGRGKLILENNRLKRSSSEVESFNVGEKNKELRERLSKVELQTEQLKKEELDLKP